MTIQQQIKAVKEQIKECQFWFDCNEESCRCCSIDDVEGLEYHVKRAEYYHNKINVWVEVLESIADAAECAAEDAMFDAWLPEHQP